MNDEGVSKTAPATPGLLINIQDPHVLVGPLSAGADSKDYSARRHFGNCNQTLESSKISTRRHQTPDEGIGTLTCKSCTREVLKN